MSEQQPPEDPSQAPPVSRYEGAPEEDAEGAVEEASQRPLPLWVRISLLMVGWLLLLVGIAGLVLPGIQGIATILFGAAVLSLASEMVYKLLRRGFQRWPSVWHRFEKFREKMRGWLHRRT
ncbi:MAG: PGPGW domain-containing protein [Acidobacteriota bacterium]|nr:PGPGW domain-containing protein [Acidobacteriota bacterium]